MKTERNALYIQVMMDLANYTAVGYDFTDERTLDRRGRGYVPSPVGPSSLKHEKRLTAKHK